MTSVRAVADSRGSGGQRTDPPYLCAFALIREIRVKDCRRQNREFLPPNSRLISIRRSATLRLCSAIS
jgi:hypothetical protein